MSRTRQAELKADYKLHPPERGVFAIRNLANGKTFLDRSNNLPGAINRHRFSLRFGGHRNAALQADWRAQGEAAFRFEIVDVAKPSTDPAFDIEAEIAALLELHLEACPRGSVNSY